MNKVISICINYTLHPCGLFLLEVEALAPLAQPAIGSQKPKKK
jgi:hypothetical protein